MEMSVSLVVKVLFKFKGKYLNDEIWVIFCIQWNREANVMTNTMENIMEIL